MFALSLQKSYTRVVSINKCDTILWRIQCWIMKKIHKKNIFWINVANSITLCLFIENLMLKAGRVSEIVYYSNVFNILLWVSGECDGGWPQHLLDNPGWLRERGSWSQSRQISPALHTNNIMTRIPCSRHSRPDQWRKW